MIGIPLCIMCREWLWEFGYVIHIILLYPAWTAELFHVLQPVADYCIFFYCFISAYVDRHVK